MSGMKNVSKIFKKKSNSGGASHGGSEIVQVVGYDVEANEIDAIRLSTGQPVRVAYQDYEKKADTKFARTEVKHLTGKVRIAGNNVAAPVGSLILCDRVQEKDGKLYTSWTTAWVRKPDEQRVVSGLASITLLDENKGVERDDGKTAYKGLMTVIGDDNCKISDPKGCWAPATELLRGYTPTLADSAETAEKLMVKMLSDSIHVGVRVRVGDDVGSVYLISNFQGDHAKKASEFMGSLEDSVREGIGKDVSLEIIPIASIRIGNETAGELFTGQKSDGKKSSASVIRERFNGGETEHPRFGKRQIKAFVPALMMAHMRQSKDVVYPSIENLHANYCAKPALGIQDAILVAATANSAIFKVAAQATADAAAAPADAPAAPAAATPAPAAAEKPDASAPAAAADSAAAAGDDTAFENDGWQFDGNGGDFDVASIFGHEEDNTPATPAKMKA